MNAIDTYAIAEELVRLHVLQPQGTQLWVVADDNCEAGARVVTSSPQETPAWAESEIVFQLGCATGPNNVDSSWWFEGHAHYNDDLGMYVRNDTGKPLGQLEDALELAVEEGHYPELIDEWSAKLQRAIVELRDSDDPRPYEIGDEHGTWDVITCKPSEVEQETRCWLNDGDYDGELTTLFLSASWRCELTGEEGSVEVTVDPEGPNCELEQGHAWGRPHLLLGGLKENPGVWSHGGGVITTDVCLLCGCVCERDTWATNPLNGTEGHKKVSYRPGDVAITPIDVEGDRAAVEYGGEAYVVECVGCRSERATLHKATESDRVAGLRAVDGEWANDADVVGYDLTAATDRPRVVCTTCATPNERQAPELARTDEWGGWSCACVRCGAELDVLLVQGGEPK